MSSQRSPRLSATEAEEKLIQTSTLFLYQMMTYLANEDSTKESDKPPVQSNETEKAQDPTTPRKAPDSKKSILKGNRAFHLSKINKVPQNNNKEQCHTGSLTLRKR